MPVFYLNLKWMIWGYNLQRPPKLELILFNETKRLTLYALAQGLPELDVGHFIKKRN
jgi:hypothetical protein